LSTVTLAGARVVVRLTVEVAVPVASKRTASPGMPGCM
jgi:hypothetical protein